jgi:predicted membrane protein
MPLLYVALALLLVAVAAKVINSYLPMDGSSKGTANIVLTLLVVGMALWLINTFVPMAGSIKAILNIVVVAAVCVRVLQAFGLWEGVVRAWRQLTYRVSH